MASPTKSSLHRGVTATTKHLEKKIPKVNPTSARIATGSKVDDKHGPITTTLQRTSEEERLIREQLSTAVGDSLSSTQAKEIQALGKITEPIFTINRTEDNPDGEKVNGGQLIGAYRNEGELVDWRGLRNAYDKGIVDANVAQNEAWTAQLKELVALKDSGEIEQAKQLQTVQQVINAPNPKGDGDDEDEEEGWLFSLDNISKVLLAAAAGVGIWETLDSILAGDTPPIDAGQALEDAIRTNTSREVSELIINASYRDQSALADLENITRYGNQFGSLSHDLFNDPTYGEFYETEYQKYLTEIGEAGGDPQDYDRDRFLREFVRANPTHPASELINESMSRIGQLEKSSDRLAELDRSLMKSGYEDAAKFYKPELQGGWGFEPDDFRSGEQKTLLDYAMGLTEDAHARYQSKGELEPDTLRAITGNAVSSVDPFFQTQQNFGGGGIAKAILNTSDAKRKRMFEDEAALVSAMGTTGNMVNSMTVDPSKALGLAGQGNWTNASGQLETGAEGFDYGNTNFHSGILANNLGIAQANENKDPNSVLLEDLGTNVSNLNKRLKDAGIGV